MTPEEERIAAAVTAQLVGERYVAVPAGTRFAISDQRKGLLLMGMNGQPMTYGLHEAVALAAIYNEMHGLY